MSKNRPLFGTVVEVEGLCNVQTAADKDTVRVEIDLGDSGLEYTPGDALGIHASNAPEVDPPSSVPELEDDSFLSSFNIQDHGSLNYTNYTSLPPAAPPPQISCVQLY